MAASHRKKDTAILFTEVSATVFYCLKFSLKVVLKKPYLMNCDDEVLFYQVGTTSV